MLTHQGKEARMKYFLTAAIAAAILTGAVRAQDSVEIRARTGGVAPPTVSIDELAWLAGHWRGEGLGGQSEEFISPPLNGQVIGMFRQTKADGSLLFYEFYQFAEEQGSVMLRIKHFNPDFTGWESKDASVEFPLVAVEQNAVYFDGLTFARTGDVLHAAVLIEGRGRADFRYERVLNPE
jgi:hypothetical protein